MSAMLDKSTTNRESTPSRVRFMMIEKRLVTRQAGLRSAAVWHLVSWKSRSPVPCRDEESYFPLSLQKPPPSSISTTGLFAFTRNPQASCSKAQWAGGGGQERKSWHVSMVPSTPLDSWRRLSADATPSSRFHGIFVTCDMHRLTPSSLAAPPHQLNLSRCTGWSPEAAGVVKGDGETGAVAHPPFDIADPHYHARVDIKHVVSMAKSPTWWSPSGRVLLRDARLEPRGNLSLQRPRASRATC